MIKTFQKTKYIILEGNLGVFLGTYSLADVYNQADIDELDMDVPEAEFNRSYAMFARDNPLGISEALSFETLSEAEAYIQDAFGKYGDLTLMPVPVKTQNHYPDVVDIIRSGYGDFTFDMMEGLPTYSDAIH